MKKPSFQKKYHASWLIAWASFGILIGTTLALAFDSFSGNHWLLLSLCLGVVAFTRRTIVAIIVVLVAGVIFGLWNGSSELQAQSGYQNYFGQEVQAAGRVSEDPSYDAEGDLRFRLSDVQIGNEQIAGELWVGTSDRIDILRSDRTLIEGRLTEGFGNIPAAIFRAEVLAVERQDYADVARDVRDDFADGIRTSIQEPEASLGAGFLLGQKTALPEKLDNELRLLGLTHIVVASGYNLTILVRFARRGFERISRFTALAFSSGLIYSFALITGFSPSMSRAAIITFISLLAWYFGRKLHPLVLLSFSAAITVIINPAYAWGDIGWLLSFTSFIGVIMFAPLVNAYFWGDKKPGNIRQVVIETLSAQLLTLPIIAYVFGEYSPLAILANVLILPLIPLAMILTFVAGIAGLMFPSAFAQFIGWPAETLLRYMTGVVDRLAQWPIASTEIQFSSTTVFISYLAIFTTMIFFWRKTGYRWRNYNVIE